MWQFTRDAKMWFIIAFVHLLRALQMERWILNIGTDFWWWWYNIFVDNNVYLYLLDRLLTLPTAKKFSSGFRSYCRLTASSSWKAPILPWHQEHVLHVSSLPHRLRTPPSQSLFVKFSQKFEPAAPCSLQTWVAICFTLSRSVVGGGFDLVKTLLRTGSEQTKKTIVTGHPLSRTWWHWELHHVDQWLEADPDYDGYNSTGCYWTITAHLVSEWL